MRITGWAFACVMVAVVAGGASFAASSDTRYVPELRKSVAQVDASWREVAALDKSDQAAVAAAGKRLASAAKAACRTLRAYRDAQYRYGTDEEWQLMLQLLGRLDEAGSKFGSLAAAARQAATPTQKSLAEQALRAYALRAARKQIAKWVKDERLSAILTTGSLRTARQRLEKEIAARIRAEARRLSLQSVGVAISLDVDIRTQARRTAEQAAVRWLAKTVLKASPNAIVVQIVGKPIVRFVATQLKRSLRNYKNVTSRTQRTLKGFDNRMAQLQRLIDRPGASRLATVRRALADAQRAIDATRYLQNDLKKQGRDALLVALKRGEILLKARMRATRAVFLLDSKLARADLRKTADDVCALSREIESIGKKLPRSGKPPGAGGCTVALRADKGKPGVTGQMTLVLRPNPALTNEVQAFVTISTTGAEGPKDDVPVIFKIWFYKKPGDPLILGQGDPRGLDFNLDAAAGRTTPQRVEGMFLNVSDRAVLAGSPFFVRLFVVAFDDKGSVGTELEGLCRTG